MRIGLLGGTFDPVHNGHVRLAGAALRQLRLDKVFFVLSPRSPFKLGRTLAPVSSRLRLLRAALKRKKKFSIGRFELKRQGPSYTIDTLAAYQKKYPAHRLFLIMGSDAYRGFEKWKNPGGILKRAQLVVGRRPGSKVASVRFKPVVLRGLFPEISSTVIRRSVRDGASLSAFVPKDVARVIRRYKIYAA